MWLPQSLWWTSRKKSAPQRLPNHLRAPCLLLLHPLGMDEPTAPHPTLGMSG